MVQIFLVMDVFFEVEEVFQIKLFFYFLLSFLQFNLIVLDEKFFNLICNALIYESKHIIKLDWLECFQEWQPHNDRISKSHICLKPLLWCLLIARRVLVLTIFWFLNICISTFEFLESLKDIFRAINLCTIFKELLQVQLFYNELFLRILLIITFCWRHI